MGKIIINKETNKLMKRFRDQICERSITEDQIINLLEDLLPEEITIELTKGGRDGVTKARMFYCEAQEKYIIGNYKGPYVFEPIVYRTSNSNGILCIALDLSDNLSESIPLCYFKRDKQTVFYLDFANRDIIKVN